MRVTPPDSDPRLVAAVMAAVQAYLEAEEPLRMAAARRGTSAWRRAPWNAFRGEAPRWAAVGPRWTPAPQERGVWSPFLR